MDIRKFINETNIEVIDMFKDENNSSEDYNCKLVLKVTSSIPILEDDIKEFIEYSFNLKEVSYQPNYNSKEWEVVITGTREKSKFHKDFMVPVELIRKLWKYEYDRTSCRRLQAVQQWVTKYWFGITY